jgi:hypothetical protein
MRKVKDYEMFIVFLCLYVITVFIFTIKYESKQCPETTLQLNPEAAFILQSVEKDTLLQSYILSPTFRERTRQAVKEFNKKHPQK